MNKKAEELELKNTHFVTPHGLDKDEHYTTAYELAIIADYALNIDKFAEVVNIKNYTVNINGRSKTINNTNELLGYLNGVNGVKTGFTNGAGRCLVTSVNRNGFNIITVVLGADTKKLRTKDSIKLIEYTYSNFELVDLEELIDDEYIKWKNINEKRINIYKAKENIVKTKLGEFNYKFYPINKDKVKDINIEIKNTKLEFVAPIYKGEKVADLFLYIDGKEILNSKIVIDNNLERKDVLYYFKHLIYSY